MENFKLLQENGENLEVEQREMFGFKDYRRF